MFISDTSLWFSIFMIFFPGFSNLRYADDTTFMAESKEELKSLLMKSERGEWKSWLKIQHSENQDHGIWSHYFMANRRETVETVTDFIFGGSKITADGNCSHEIKRRLLLGRKVMTNLDSIIKSRGITLPTKVCLVTVRERSNTMMTLPNKPHSPLMGNQKFHRQMKVKRTQLSPVCEASAPFPYVNYFLPPCKACRGQL